MGYTTWFTGEFTFNKKLDAKTYELLYGIYKGLYPENNGTDYDDKHFLPTETPSKYCKWAPTNDRKRLVWSRHEKFYGYIEWLEYLIENVIAINGYILNGKMQWMGEGVVETDHDFGNIVIINNVIYTYSIKESELITPEELMPDCITERSDVIKIPRRNKTKLPIRIPDGNSPIVLTIIGNHAGEQFESIIERKINDIKSCGFCLWKYMSYNCAKRHFANLESVKEIPCYFVKSLKDGSNTKIDDIAFEYSNNNGNTWNKFDEKMSPVIGVNKSSSIKKNTCLYITNIERREFDINLADYINSTKNKSLERFDYGGSTVLAYKANRPSIINVHRKVVAVATITNPFIALVR